MRPLTGSELVNFVNDNKGMPQDEVMIQAGYFCWKKRVSGEEFKSVRKFKFFQALSHAMGTQIGVDIPSKTGRPKNRLKITSNTTLPVGPPHLRAIGLGEGDYVRVKVDKDKLIIEPWSEDLADPIGPDDNIPFDGSAEVETCSMPAADECSVPRRTQLEITETCSYTPEQCAVG